MLQAPETHGHPRKRIGESRLHGRVTRRTSVARGEECTSHLTLVILVDIERIKEGGERRSKGHGVTSLHRFAIALLFPQLVEIRD